VRLAWKVVLLTIVFFASVGFAGGALNEHVCSINGGVMPVIADSDTERAIVLGSINEEEKEGDVRHSLATTTTRWAWAADRIPFYLHDIDASGNVVESEGFASLGDILVLAGFPCAAVGLMVCLMGLLRFIEKKLGITQAT
jgi:hypothetical protein